MSARIAVVGGGVAGLVTAWRLEQQLVDAQIVVFEASNQVGGKVLSTREDGYVIERGPNGFLDHEPAMRDLVQRLGLERRQRRSQDEARRRYLVHSGAFVELPSSPPGLLTSPVLSPMGRARVLMERFVAKGDGSDETIDAFARRRFGDQAAEMLADPMVKGIFGGDSRALSVGACLPKVVALEQEHGSVISGAMASRKTSKGEGSPNLYGFLGGMQDLTDGLTSGLKAEIRLSTPVREIVRGDLDWVVRTSAGEDHFDVVIDASPAWAAAKHAPDSDLRVELEGIHYAPMAVVTLAWPNEAMGHRPVGFGALVPTSEKRPFLGVLWSNQVFPAHAPDGVALLRFMCGGAAHPELLDLSDEKLLDFSIEQLTDLHKLSGSPSKVWTTRWERAIPQYQMGHLGRLARLNQVLSKHPGLYLTGSSYRGVSVVHCVAEATRVAADVVASIQR